ncbi:hypothetical protein [Methanolobus psychrotolerans]|uniref:hypothetical protein n=1 Tax=Methanolobus psychrotolerans TaxID=1874706 RepID=UPI000B91B159|nr:hypothetical protein [Methanolobus psychrotolerans]
MFIKSKCPYENRTCYHDVCFRIKKEVMVNGEEHTERQTIKDIEIADTVSEEELASCIICELKGHMYDGMTTGEFCKLLKNYYGVASRYCCDLLQRMKVELDMYCPDRQHLYFVKC